jgi:hypothetical protein
MKTRPYSHQRPGELGPGELGDPERYETMDTLRNNISVPNVFGKIVEHPISIEIHFTTLYKADLGGIVL